MIKINCLNCGKEKSVFPRDIKRGWGKYCSQSCSNKQNRKATGENHGNWKDKEVGYAGIHAYILRWKPKPDICERCKKSPPLDLANKSGNYLRTLTDWQWLCRKCHMDSDGRLEKLKATQFKPKIDFA